MISSFIGVEYGRGATARLVTDGPALVPRAVQKMFPDKLWTILTAQQVDKSLWKRDRFADTMPIQRALYENTPNERHIMIGGDHSLNFGHFAAIADKNIRQNLCLVYVDAHLDAHTPASSLAEASGAPHGTNVHALTGDGDKRWMALQKKIPALKPENIFYLGARSYEPAELKFIHENNIYMKSPAQVAHNINKIIDEVRKKIGKRKFVLSFDFDAIDPKYFSDVLVPEPNGISVPIAEKLVTAFRDAIAIEFVEYAPTGDIQSAEIVKKLITIAMGE